MRHVLILGRGGAGKSTLARRLGSLTGLPVIELDDWFWRPGPVPTPREQWMEIQRELIGGERWIIDGDLGPYDVLEPRLRAADTVIVLDYSLPRCAWRSIRRSSERAGFWRWVIAYRRRSLPALMASVAARSPAVRVHVFRSPKTTATFLAGVADDTRDPRL